MIDKFIQYVTPEPQVECPDGQHLEHNANGDYCADDGKGLGLQETLIILYSQLI